MIDKNEDSIIVARFEKINNEVTRDTPLRDIRNSDRCKLTHTLVLKWLRPRAEIIGGNILFDKLIYTRKVIVFRKQLYDFYYAEMSC